MRTATYCLEKLGFGISFSLMTKFCGRPYKPIPSTLLKSLCQQGLSYAAIRARLVEAGFNVCVTTVRNQAAAFKVKSVRSGSGGPKLSERGKRALSRLVRVHGIRTAPQLQKEMAKRGFTVHRSSIWRSLNANPNLRLQRPRKRPFMTEQHRLARQQWAVSAKYDWHTVFFGDEKTFDADGPAFRPRIWCDRRDPPPILPRRGQHQPRVAVFGCFSLNRVPDLVRIGSSYNSKSYCEALGSTLQRGNVLLHDRHPVHTSAETSAFYGEKKVWQCALPSEGCRSQSD